MEHFTSVKSLVVLPNGDFASGSEHQIVVWHKDENTGKWITKRAMVDVTCLLVALPNGGLASVSKRAASQKYDQIKIWNTNTGVCKKVLQVEEGIVDSIVVLQNGKLATTVANASVSACGTICIWDTDTGQSTEIRNATQRARVRELVVAHWGAGLPLK